MTQPNSSARGLSYADQRDFYRKAIVAIWNAVRDHGYCPVCKGNREDGHEYECALATAYEETQR